MGSVVEVLLARRAAALPVAAMRAYLAFGEADVRLCAAHLDAAGVDVFLAAKPSADAMLRAAQTCVDVEVAAKLLFHRPFRVTLADQLLARFRFPDEVIDRWIARNARKVDRALANRLLAGQGLSPERTAALLEMGPQSTWKFVVGRALGAPSGDAAVPSPDPALVVKLASKAPASRAVLAACATPEVADGLTALGHPVGFLAASSPLAFPGTLPERLSWSDSVCASLVSSPATPQAWRVALFERLNSPAEVTDPTCWPEVDLLSELGERLVARLVDLRPYGLAWMADMLLLSRNELLSPLSRKRASVAACAALEMVADVPASADSGPWDALHSWAWEHHAAALQPVGVRRVPRPGAASVVPSGTQPLSQIARIPSYAPGAWAFVESQLSGQQQFEMFFSLADSFTGSVEELCALAKAL